MTRVLVESIESGTPIVLRPDRSHHLVRVLRMQPGEPLEACDGRGGVWRAVIDAADPRAATLRLLEPVPIEVESPLRITLAQCLSSADRMDWTVEKAVELGVSAIVPLSSERSTLRLDPERAARKHAHWQAIVESAFLQCGRSWLPSLAPVQRLRDFIDALAGQTCESGGPEQRLVLDPRARDRLGSVVVDPDRPIVLLAGPESGLSPEEIAASGSAGFRPVSIGPRILRTETAGLAAIAALQAIAGDFRADSQRTPAAAE